MTPSRRSAVPLRARGQPGEDLCIDADDPASLRMLDHESEVIVEDPIAEAGVAISLTLGMNDARRAAPRRGLDQRDEVGLSRVRLVPRFHRNDGFLGPR